MPPNANYIVQIKFYVINDLCEVLNIYEILEESLNRSRFVEIYGMKWSLYSLGKLGKIPNFLKIFVKI